MLKQLMTVTALTVIATGCSEWRSFQRDHLTDLSNNNNMRPSYHYPTENRQVDTSTTNRQQ